MAREITKYNLNKSENINFTLQPGVRASAAAQVNCYSHNKNVGRKGRGGCSNQKRLLWVTLQQGS